MHDRESPPLSLLPLFLFPSYTVWPAFKPLPSSQSQTFPPPSFDKLPRPPQSSHRSASIGSEPCEVDQVSMLDAFLRFAHVPCSEFELRLGPWLTRIVVDLLPCASTSEFAFRHP